MKWNDCVLFSILASFRRRPAVFLFGCAVCRHGDKKMIEKENQPPPLCRLPSNVVLGFISHNVRMLGVSLCVCVCG